MKRISILVTVLIVALCHAAAARYTVPLTCGITYSPYALEFGRSGLIPECVKYSPYALEHGYSGLIPDNVRYSPYAYDMQHNGLISDLACCYLPGGTWDDVPAQRKEPERPCTASCHACPGTCPSETASGAQVWGSRPSQPSIGGTEARNDRLQMDQRRAIREYLSKTSPGRFEITRLLSMDNEAVCFDVVLKDKNVVIKYWNGIKIESIKRQGNCRQKALTNYLQEWIDYRDQFEAAGGKVYHIASEDTYELLRELATYLRADNT